MTTTSQTARPWQLPDLPFAEVAVPSVDRETMVEVDRIATDTFNLGLLQMMENAGRELANLAFLTLGASDSARAVADGTRPRVTVLAGTGNNAGGGLVAARHLAGWGVTVEVIFARPVMKLRPAACQQLDLAWAAGVGTAVAGHDRSHAEVADLLGSSGVVLDALIGYSLAGAPDTAYRSLIDMAGMGPGAVISLDLPSGVDATTGATPGAAVRADATLALALPKTGTQQGNGRRLAGRLYLADIGIPAAVYAEAGVPLPPIFGAGPLIRLPDDSAAGAASRR